MAAVFSSQTKPPQASQNMYKQNISEVEIESDLCRIVCTKPVLPVENLLPIFRSADNMWGTTSLLALTECKCLANIPVWLWRKQKLCFHSTPSSEGVESTILLLSTAGPLVVNSLRGITRHPTFCSETHQPIPIIAF